MARMEITIRERTQALMAKMEVNVQFRILWWGRAWLAVCDFIPLLFFAFRVSVIRQGFIYHGFRLRIDEGRWEHFNHKMLVAYG